jgi:beta-N-acetylhexosaminidase
MVDVSRNPFFLNEEQAKWVEDTLHSMTLEEKVGQLFCPMGFSSEDGPLQHDVCQIGVGGMMYRMGIKNELQDTHRKIQNMAKIPLLLAANTEAGGNGLAFDGTSFGAPLAVAATDDPENAYRMGYVACAEGAALGLNWSFAPIVDIDMEFHNPITNTRTFGSDPERVIACSEAYMRGADENGIAVSIKHFPGDGVDERDQHLGISVNSLDAEEWMATYGLVYKTLIDKGAKTVMVGHIAQPAMVKKINPQASREATLLPATESTELLNGLLRGELGFNGLITTDATPMIAFTTSMPRRKAIPSAIASGADIILFNKNLDEDYGYMMEGVRTGVVTLERLDEAVIRILATKASLDLPKKKAEGTLVPGSEALKVMGSPEFQTWAKDVADKAVTLVRDKQNLLPISPEKYPRLYLNVIQKSMDPSDSMVENWKTLFEKEGFEVTVRDRRTSIDPKDFGNPNLSLQKQYMMHEMYRGVEEMKKNYDLYVYVANMQNASNNTTLRLNWNVCFGLGDDAPWFAKEIPVMMISVGNPYHLFDAPMIDTYINAYSNIPDFCQATVDKVMGRSEFMGVSPVDPYCGKDFLK